MKKFTKIFVIFGVLFLIAGIALFTAGMTLSDWDFSKLNTALYVQREYTAAGKDITSLRVEFECADMTVETSAETDTIQISYPVRVDAEERTFAGGVRNNGRNALRYGEKRHVGFSFLELYDAEGAGRFAHEDVRQRGIRYRYGRHLR